VKKSEDRLPCRLALSSAPAADPSTASEQGLDTTGGEGAYILSDGNRANAKPQAANRGIPEGAGCGTRGCSGCSGASAGELTNRFKEIFNLTDRIEKIVLTVDHSGVKLAVPYFVMDAQSKQLLASLKEFELVRKSTAGRACPPRSQPTK
jgi:hypothetical protein